MISLLELLEKSEEVKSFRRVHIYPMTVSDFANLCSKEGLSCPIQPRDYDLEEPGCIIFYYNGHLSWCSMEEANNNHEAPKESAELTIIENVADITLEDVANKVTEVRRTEYIKRYPMTKGYFLKFCTENNINCPINVSITQICEPGFAIIYPDRYISWCSVDVADDTHEVLKPTPIDQFEQDIENEIQEKGLTAPRLTPDHINSVIERAYYNVVPGTATTTCTLTLSNGFNVTGESSPGSLENFDREIGEQIAFKDARDKIWQLEGYLLKERLYQESQSK